MKTIFSILGAGLFLAGAGVCQASLIAGWDFANISASPSTPATFAAQSGAGTIDISAFDGATERNAFSGTTVNGYAGGSTTTSGLQAFALLGGTSVGGIFDANGKSLIISASMSGFQGLVVSYATQRTATGFSNQDWSYSNDGIAYTAFSSLGSLPASFATETVDFSSITALNGDSSIFLKLTLSGASSSAGNNRFDNFQLNAAAAGSAVPEPGEWGLISALGLLGICGVSTWRRHCAARRAALVGLRN